MTLPPELFNRTGDNWRGLFSIAEAAGGEWPELAEQAAMEEISEEDSNLILQLLEAIWQIFAEKKVVRMHTKVLLRRPDEHRGGAVEGRRTTAARSTATGCGKSSRASCRGPQIPKRRRRSAVPANGGRGKARPSKATRRTICAKPGGATSSARLRPRPPKRPAPRMAASGMPRQTSRPRPRIATGPCGGWRGCKRGRATRACGETAPHNGHGPAKRRTRPSEAQARRGGMIAWIRCPRSLRPGALQGAAVLRHRRGDGDRPRRRDHR